MSSRFVLPDVLGPGLKVVFCGTAAGTASARRGAYYAGPGNLFWPTLYRVGLTPRLLAPEEFREVLRYGIGLTDLAKRTFGQDATLRDVDFDRERLRRVVLRYRPRVLAFTSKRAGREFSGRAVGFGVSEIGIGGTRVVVLPSPSGLARGSWEVRWWWELERLGRGA